MSRFSLLSALTGERSVPSVGLLSALVASRPQQLSIAEAARRGGVSKATATRAVDHLVESGLVVEHETARERRLSINVNSPLYPQAADLVWVERGIQAPRSVFGDARREEPPFAIHDLDVRALVPPELQHPREYTLEGEEHDGPELVRARARMLDLERLAGEHANLDRLLEQSWNRWRAERDRDLMHLIVHLGQGAAQAARALRASATTSAARKHGHIGRLAWVHATYAVAAEARLCAGAQDHLSQTLTRAQEFHDAEAAAFNATARVEHARSHSQPAETLKDLEQTRDRLVDQREQARLVYGKDYGYGGASRPESVGTAGERLLIAHVQRLGERAAVLAEDMIAENAFARWRQDHPDVAARWPLPPNPTGTTA